MGGTWKLGPSIDNGSNNNTHAMPCIHTACVCVCRRSNIQSQLAGLSRCMDDLTSTLDAWDDEAAGGGMASVAHAPPSTVVYATLALQV